MFFREKCAQVKLCLYAKTDQGNMWVHFYVRGQQETNFHWRKCYYGLQTYILVRSGGLKLKTLIIDLQTCSISLHSVLNDGLEWCGLLWCNELFGLSFWRHPFTAEHPLLSKWCNATFLHKSVLMKKQTHLPIGWP